MIFCENPFIITEKGDSITENFYFPVNCRKCEICLAQNKQKWSNRMFLESLDRQGKYQYFWTLTYNDENLEDLNKRVIQLLFKRIRSYFAERNLQPNIKYFVAGEYGEQKGRPHYHAICFSDVPIDIKQFWNYGFSDVKRVTIQSIRYVAKYSQKQEENGKLKQFKMFSRGLGFDMALKFFGKSRDKSGTDIAPSLSWQGFKVSLDSYLKNKVRKAVFGLEYFYKLKKVLKQEFKDKIKDLYNDWQELRDMEFNQWMLNKMFGTNINVNYKQLMKEIVQRTHESANHLYFERKKLWKKPKITYFS